MNSIITSSKAQQFNVLDKFGPEFKKANSASVIRPDFKKAGGRIHLPDRVLKDSTYLCYMIIFHSKSISYFIIRMIETQ